MKSPLQALALSGALVLSGMSLDISEADAHPPHHSSRSHHSSNFHHGSSHHGSPHRSIPYYSGHSHFNNPTNSFHGYHSSPRIGFPLMLPPYYPSVIISPSRPQYNFPSIIIVVPSKPVYRPPVKRSIPHHH